MGWRASLMRRCRPAPPAGNQPTCQGVIVMAATNLPETLDPALKRPGRVDRQVRAPRARRQPPQPPHNWLSAAGAAGAAAERRASARILLGAVFACCRGHGPLRPTDFFWKCSSVQHSAALAGIPLTRAWPVLRQLS
jgi:hypothetical protein